jgi:membrane protease YdiL (CAAX protease family)
MNDLRQASTPNLVAAAVVFELALAPVGGAIAWVADVPLASLLRPESGWVAAVGYGILATMPMVPLLVAMLMCQWRPIAWLRRLVSRFVQQLFGRAPLWQLAVVSLAAGFGEEVLFRGAIQPLAVSYTSPSLGVAIASLLFGLVHAASWTYFWLAAGVGAYLGILAQWRGEIVSAMVAHALYDFVALTLVARGYFQRHRPLFSVRSRLSDGR